MWSLKIPPFSVCASFCFFPANRAVEVNEMWRVRQKELALDRRHGGTSRDLNRSHSDGNLSRCSGRFGMDDNCAAASASCSSKRESDHYSEGLRDEELEMFLNSRYYC